MFQNEKKTLALGECSCSLEVLLSMSSYLKFGVECAAPWIFLFYNISLLAEGFTVSGTIEFRAFRNKQTVYLENREFSLIYDAHTGCWKIRTSKAGSIDYAEKSFDGSYIYGLNSQFLQTNGTISRANVGKIEEFAVPEPDGSRINTLWVGYASAGYFKSLTNKMVYPPWLLDDPTARLGGFAVEANWALNKDAVGLPAVVIYKSDGIFHGMNERNGKPITFRERPPFDNGYTQAVFKVTESKNLGTCAVPLAFTFSRFSVASGNYELLTEEVVSAQDVENTSQQVNFPPGFVGKADIYDGRFKVPSFSKPGQYDYFRYSSSNGIWPNFAEVALRYGTVMNFVHRHHTYAKTGTGYAKRLIVVSVMVLSAVLLTYLLRKHEI